MQSRLDKSRERGMAMANDSLAEPMSEEERLRRGAQRQQEALDELNKALAEARLNGQKGMEEVQKPQSAANDTLKSAGTVTENEDAVTQPPEDAATQSVVKVRKPNSAYFNTLVENEPEPNLIKAIIDEDVKAVDGSRVRLRLLDEVEINGVILAKGSYTYAIMSGFGQQRVKGTVKSLMVDDELLKVSLTLYDTDGMEGLLRVQFLFPGDHQGYSIRGDGQQYEHQQRQLRQQLHAVGHAGHTERLPADHRGYLESHPQEQGEAQVRHIRLSIPCGGLCVAAA